MPHEALVDEIRRFNRFYTGLVGLLDETLMQSPYTLIEARVLFELGRGSRTAGGRAGFLARMFDLDLAPVASELAGELGLAPAYLLRVLRKFTAMGLAEMRAGPEGGLPVLSLTSRGEAALADLEAATDRDLARLIAKLGGEEALALSDALSRVSRLLETARM
ncbi:MULTISPECIES: MarR family transcriptional regulator [unclassified Mesorhizobium]|uniref:MarR family transcriptional regulator n=1 Tax=unclassified Mesorhizobium TaxID=325217 RepID=UPI000FCA8BB5|nr:MULTISPECIES: MarR family transcriptional regulator [unclassified Mesorhizobium]RUW35979.1 MarR family transcriptional regulator [Mesorhizobium sp. M1E.F.Ca.ET.041.01.1.1]RUW82533.1 MarR family transcriptional regulator [Mesorhizobium sp. M1E.F.Ca.ET.063.01.1.1]RWD80978.1 MAG: MarR family transcriptional regulator [Mesorhizobium sp.]RWD84151.1 MAG: MarR family transcriptional regulator [Mesorhizobium sp.]TIV51780.1 MAG: MarR family transcriptional regulator [Mesorhizobium sp.]